MIKLMRVTGNSLSPSFLEGDFILVIKTSLVLRGLKPGDTVVFHHPHYGTLIKKIEWISADGSQLYVIGSQPDSVDSRRFGTVPVEEVIGKVVLHLQKP